MKTIGNQYIIKTDLDNGATATVYLVECIKTGKIYAAKLYDKINDDNKTEIEILKRLSSSNNPYIIHLISWGEEYILIDGVAENNEKKLFIIIDYLPNKDLFSYIKSNKIDENMAKNLFYKILKAVEYCHSQGICHRDIKLENILLNEKNEPVLCDFGYGSLSIENLKYYIGSEHYYPPEILRHKPYNGIKSDIFSLGVLLFVLVFKSYGFETATFNDYLYKLIMKKKFSAYWNNIGNIYGEEKVKVVSLDCKKLIFKMLAFSPIDRPSIKDILNSNWLKDVQKK